MSLREGLGVYINWGDWYLPDWGWGAVYPGEREARGEGVGASVEFWGWILWENGIVVIIVVPCYSPERQILNHLFI